MSSVRSVALPWPADDVAARLGEVDVVVCTASLLAAEGQLEEALAILSSDERCRFAAYTNAIVARRFAVGRRILREIVGRALGMRPDEVPLREGLHGKPFVSRSAGARALWFSVAHSEDMLLVAVSRQGDVGVDLERERSIEQWQRVADRVLDQHERRHLERAVEHGEDPGSAFLRQWCRVEAELKAIGCGIVGLEAHRSGLRPRGLALSDLPSLPLPADIAASGVHYLAAVALCHPVTENDLHMTLDKLQRITPTDNPASASTP
jgi:4'-phosphopantetheinyl transferase